MQTLQSYLLGRWQAGESKPIPLHNPATEEVIAELRSPAPDFGAVLAHAREHGRGALARMTFRERGALLQGLSGAIHARREELIEASVENGGSTRSDAKFDVDGATGTLMAYAELAQSLPDAPYLADGDLVPLTRSPRFAGQHAWFPRPGVAVHVNAFNFPTWGQAEKMAQALLAGVPVIEKPGTPTALVAWKVAQAIVESRVFPEGAYQFVAGSTGDLLERLGADDHLAFTGSSATAAKLRALPNLLQRSVRVNVEADSLNAAVLAPDVEAGADAYGLFLSNVVLDMTQKAGQKCTAVRRILVPAARAADVRADLVTELSRIRVGDPAEKDVRMGPLASAAQHADVRAGLERLAGAAETATGGGAPRERGWFLSPALLVARDARAAVLHDREVFGPVATILPYGGDAEEAAALVGLGGGGLVASAYSNDGAWMRRFVLGAAPHHGRLWLGSDKMAEQSLPPGMVLPGLVHGGPGRAGGGEELGGLRGLEFYLQRTALQGFRGWLEGEFAPPRAP